jgi:hypothetical protein
MMTASLVIGMLVWLQVKHFVADYLLQSAWILGGKGDFAKPGGYVHAGLHAVGSLPVYFVAGLSGVAVVGLAASEFVVHYLIDHGKAVYSRSHHNPMNSSAFWALHGADQLLHNLTYSALLYAIVILKG